VYLTTCTSHTARSLRPSLAEFADPIQFIESVKQAGDHFGIVKIIPPPGWSPPPQDEMHRSCKTPVKTRLQSLKYFKEGTGVADGKDYTFAEYENMAVQFSEKWKKDRYQGQGKDAPTHEDLERDYWRIIEAAEEVVDVEYGNDLDTLTYGSGFPRAADLMMPRSEGSTEDRFAIETIGKDREGRGRLLGTPEYYERCGWNMNNLPLWPGSVLRYIRAPLKGVNVPWLYLGMQFATFCWHNEDNFMFSINYLHRGAAKQWYSIPGSKADVMEKVMKGFLREVFANNPDLLHHMTNQFHPVLFHRAGVPVFKARQEPGEFIVTFPKSFHAGFNYGFNVAEAVNFSPPLWLPLGREAMERYRRFARESVVSHDRLVLTLAHNLCPEWSIPSLQALLHDLTLIVKEEEFWRSQLTRQGLRVDIVPQSKLLPNNLKEMDDASLDYDEKRVCLSCKHVCFLSAVACECSESKVVCLREVPLLCKCRMDQRYLMAWHSISDLWDMVRRVEEYLKARQGEMGKRDGLKEEEEGGGSTTSDGEESGGTL
jgi:histone demethylase JARID1